MGSGLLWNKGKLRCFLDNRKAHPPIDSFLRFFKRMMDGDSPLRVVSLRFSSSRPSRFPRFSGNFTSLEQPDKLRVFRDIKLQIALGRLERFLQPFISNWISFLRYPIDAWILYSLVQLWRINFSRFEAPIRSGISINFWESLRSMSFNSFKICYKPISN